MESLPPNLPKLTQPFSYQTFPIEKPPGGESHGRQPRATHSTPRSPTRWPAVRRRPPPLPRLLHRDLGFSAKHAPVFLAQSVAATRSCVVGPSPTQTKDLGWPGTNSAARSGSLPGPWSTEGAVVLIPRCCRLTVRSNRAPPSRRGSAGAHSSPKSSLRAAPPAA